jgi:monoamine oxidase
VALQGYLTDLMRKYKKDPSFTLPALKQIIVTRWLSNEFTLGSYSFREVDSDNIYYSDLATPVMVNDVPKVLFAGEATIDEYHTAVHGALASGAREAKRILDLK